MLRVTVVGVALAISVAACTNKDRNAGTGDTAVGGMAAPAGTTSTAPSSTADTMGAMAPGTTDTSSAAGAIDTMTNRAGAAVDTLANRAGQAATEAKEAVGGAASTAAIRTQLAALSNDQVKQLQTALNNDGCNVGTPDGEVGEGTRKGVQCSLEKHGISSTNVDSLYKVLNLNFQ
jgi:peptidoglycan hydrolase-like protein with peptidoglycan-binding domain